MSKSSTRTLTLGHSPDPDDAFMFFGMAAHRIDTQGWSFEHVLQDIQTLNERAMRGELDITAVSIHAYPYVFDRYVLTPCGSSMGDRYGPMIVARRPMGVGDLNNVRIAVPGEMTTAFLVLNLMLGKGTFSHGVVMFDRIIPALAQGEFEAGLIIHEGQLTYQAAGLHKIVDLGEWWHSRTGLPLPLGGNCIRRDLGLEGCRQVTDIIQSSIQYGLAHRPEAVQYALRFARDMNTELADRFIGMYVNEWTVDYGDVGRRAVRELLHQAHQAALVPAIPDESAMYV